MKLLKNYYFNKFNFFVIEGMWKTSYLVTEFDGEWQCGCPHFLMRHLECKHIKFAKEILKQQDINNKVV